MKLIYLIDWSSDSMQLSIVPFYLRLIYVGPPSFFNLNFVSNKGRVMWLGKFLSR